MIAPSVTPNFEYVAHCGHWHEAEGKQISDAQPSDPSREKSKENNIMDMDWSYSSPLNRGACDHIGLIGRWCADCIARKHLPTPHYDGDSAAGAISF
jgi:hypothetical protein